MTRRSMVLFALPAALLIALAWISWSVHLQPGIDRANFERIREGMTAADVEKLFGAPGRVVEMRGERMIWNSSQISAHVFFDGRGRVSGKALVAVDEPFLDRLRRRLGL